jgi:hypothetical protein
MRIDEIFCFAIDLVTASAAGHEYPKQRLQNNGHRICLIELELEDQLSGRGRPGVTAAGAAIMRPPRLAVPR